MLITAMRSPSVVNALIFFGYNLIVFRFLVLVSHSSYGGL